MITSITNLSLLAVAALALGLSACGGGGDGLIANGDGVMPGDGNTPSVPSTLAQFGSQDRSFVFSLLSNSQVRFVGVAVYAGTEITGIDSSFDGSRVTATINPSSASPVNLDE